MTAAPADSLDTIFRALGDPTRRAMVRRLAEGDQTVSDLALPFHMSLAGVSKHIQVLAAAGLVRQTTRGRQRVCHLEPAALAAADDWLSFYRRFWSDSLDRLEQVLTERPDDGPSRP